MYQSQNPEQRLVTTAHIAQTMTILGMSSDEIREKIEGEVSVNPFLELLEDRICPICKRRLPESGKCPVCSAPKSADSTDNIFFVSPRDDFHVGRYTGNSDTYQDEPDYDSAETDDLPTYVLKQIGADLSDDKEKMIAAHLLTGLDEDGFITADLYEISMYYHVPPSKIEKVIQMIQHADPLGVGSRDLVEALLVQLRHIRDLVAVPPHTEEIIQNDFDDLTHGRYKEIGKRYGISAHQVEWVEKFIGDNLNPYPARAHWGENVNTKKSRNTNALHEPDILISYLNDEPENPLVVEVVMPISGYLQVNQYFKKEMRKAPDEKIDEWKSDLEKAELLVKSFYQRNNTITLLMKHLVVEQEDYIRKGESFLKPLTRASVAEALNLHESTVSRAVNNKTVMLPNRKVVPLASFFDRSLNVRTVLKEMIQNETKPLTDAKLVSMLKERGFDVARRTVAKYRLMEGIGSAHQRGSSKTNA